MASVLLERGFLKKVEPEIEEDLPSLYVNLKRFPKDIEAAGDSEPDKFPRILMNNVFNGKVKESLDYRNKLSNKDRTDIDRAVQRFRDYQFPVQIIQETDYPTVGKIFSLVNSQGTQLTGAEIHIASIIPHWRGISREFRSYRRDLRKVGYDLDLTFLMKAITVVACDVPQIKKLADKITQGNLSKAQLNRIWSQSKHAIGAVIRTLRKELLLDRSQFFASKNALIPLVYYVAKSPKRLDRKAMMKYFLVSQLGGHYSAQADTVLRRDLRDISEPGISPRQGFRDLLESAIGEAKRDYRGLRIKSSQVNGVPSKNVIVLFMYTVMRRRNATDFGLVDAQSLAHIQGSKLHLHHIFPYDFMMNDRKALDYMKNQGFTMRDYRDEVNDIANITFLSQEKNTQIGNVSPWQYLDNETTLETRKAHFIPEDKDLWKPDNFDRFLDQRRKMMAKAINSLIRSLH